MDPSQTSNSAGGKVDGVEVPLKRRESFASQNSQTASDFINEQLRLEADAREALPYSFDNCTRPLGALRQSLFSCLTCNPPPENTNSPYNPAGVCYSCSISCHGEHELVELFTKRDFTCDCGTKRLPSTSPCTLRADPATGEKGVHSEDPTTGNKYNQNFRNRFCGCGDTYDPAKEKGTMFQCLGIGTVENGGCGEDWWHPECLRGLPRVASTDKEEDEDPPLPPGFPDEDDFETFICYKCLDSNPWIKRYAGTPGFLPPVYLDEKRPSGSPKVVEDTGVNATESVATPCKKRTFEDEDTVLPDLKRAKQESPTHLGEPNAQIAKTKEKHDLLPLDTPKGQFSLFVKEDFRDHLCKCVECFPYLKVNPQLREEEDVYEPPLSEDGDGQNANTSAGSIHTGSLLDRGEAALSNLDRVKAIEGVMVYNHLRDKVKEFLKPFAESGQAVGAEDIKSYFEKLRGDDRAIHEAGGKPSTSHGEDDPEDDEKGDNRREQNGE
ncbi:metaphase-anaphase transition protein mlo2 [Nannizzia gypsea CBS 118893]|uniref:Metaphase-anaphase transition protein mlo2 n=1 Tax=Arthroderma gypseum (strain ATCC MYA-4604 / CBS 118893) TaxID=535722 RepID=E5R183_ARTGP|nr:metaphase-anaphase transition protein mlo2 [Nannizzia gypsea CBS 118893]EFQ98472.1 metaphase-anaphase transition protein mlo2 [Nannizzia gypsea CBS 118893]